MNTLNHLRETTFTEAEQRIRRLGFRLQKTGWGNLYAVRFGANKNAPAHVTHDLNDAIETARAIRALTIDAA